MKIKWNSEQIPKMNVKNNVREDGYETTLVDKLPELEI